MPDRPASGQSGTGRKKRSMLEHFSIGLKEPIRDCFGATVDQVFVIDQDANEKEPNHT